MECQRDVAVRAQIVHSHDYQGSLEPLFSPGLANCSRSIMLQPSVIYVVRRPVIVVLWLCLCAQVLFYSKSKARRGKESTGTRPCTVAGCTPSVFNWPRLVFVLLLQLLHLQCKTHPISSPIFLHIQPSRPGFLHVLKKQIAFQDYSRVSPEWNKFQTKAIKEFPT